MPILKQLVSGSSHTKRRSRMDLTREMISAPLGDFRHTMHVGRSGDAFGDTSFLSSRSGEPPSQATSYPHSPRPGLLSRTFRSSKRSQSVTRVDQQRDNTLVVPDGSPTYVKNAMSLPFLNNDDRGDGMVAKSLSSSPLKHDRDSDGRPLNGAAAAAHCLEMDERNFGELTELPESSHHYGGGMKHAESVMSFHVDLGPSMLGEILGVMEKEDDDLGYEEGKSSEGHVSPSLSTHEEDAVEVRKDEDNEEQEVAEVEVEVEEEEEEEEEAELQQVSIHLASSVHLGPEHGGPYTPEFTPETRPKHLQNLDSSSMSSSGSAILEEKASSQTYAGDTDSATFSAPPEEESNFSSFMEDEDDEIRV
ncbi:cdc42 effector protein 4a [Myripristis murdjan]|uniref:CDC42 effector protein (Rho GTPase binding) 4a n=1 Tax=Myripristis murdjan TaxID=586833 RepID=A0A667WHH4_9TELE|nr:cdc42 effector protein 4-like [Myripristis murdjan]